MIKRVFLTIFALVILITSIICVLPQNQNVAALELPISSTETEILSQYVKGEEVTIPDTINVDYYGTQVASNPYVVYPNGLTLKTKTLKFTETGVYKINYSLNYNSLPITFTQEIKVLDDYFTISTDNGSYIKKSSSDDRLISNQDGVIASLAEDTILYYNKIINLNDCGEDGLTNIIEIDPRLGMIEDGQYVPLQSKIYVVLTDCYDERITMTLKMQRSENYSGTFFPGVITYMQECKGLDKGDYPNLGPTRQIVLDGEKYRLWPDETGSMNVGLFNYYSSMTTGAKWKYEPSTKRVYLSYNDSTNFLVTDLDEPIIYENEGLFPGFTTGEVKLSIHAITYYTPSNARLEIVSIGNDKMYDLLDSKYVDDINPVINLDIKQDSFNVALGETVTIPKATVVDSNNVKDVTVNVYTGYYSENKVNVSVTNNTFYVGKLNLYTIEYKATDKAGNTTIKTVDVIAKETSNNQTIEIAYPVVSLTCGNEVDLKCNVISSLNSKVEDVNVKIHIKSTRQTLTLESDYKFIPYYDDEYEIDYEYFDDISTYHSKYTVTCEKTDEVFFTDKWVLPKYFIKSFKYSLDPIYAYSFTNGYPETIIPKYYAVFDNGDETLINNINAFEISGDNTVKLIARSDSYEYVSEIIEIVDISYNDDSKKIDMTKLFFGDFTPSCMNDKGNRIADIVFKSNKTSGSNTLSFVNSVLVDMFKFTYKITKDNANFDSFTIKLTDYNDSSLFTTITLLNKEEGAYISINGEDEIKLSDYDFASNSKMTVFYNYYSSSLYVGTNIVKVKFNCPSTKCYIDVTLNGIKGNAAIQISQINNQVISGNNYNDNAGPEIVYEDFQGHYALGDIVNISSFIPVDVLKGVNMSSVSFYVVAPNNSTAVDEMGNPLTDLDPNKTYTLKLTEIGNYYVVYKVEDFNSKISTAQVCVSCVDTTSPTVTLNNMNDGATILVKAGEDIRIDFTISDDISECKNMKAFIHLYCIDQYSYVPNISKIDYKNMPEDGKFTESFMIDVRGNYEAQIHVYDENGNETVKRIRIIVE